MRKLLLYLPFQLSVFLILGICAQFFFKVWQLSFSFLLIFHALFLLILIFINHKKIRTFSTFLYFFFVGISAVFVQNDSNYSDYYQRLLKSNSIAILKIDKVLKSSSFHDKYQAKVIQIDNQKTRGFVLLNIEKDSFSSSLKVDEILVVKSNFSELNPPQNLHQFDYKKYLEKRGIRYQLFLKNNELLLFELGKRTLVGLSAEFRDLVKASLRKYNFHSNEMAVMSALLLGERKEISKELLTDYSKAGAIHILAVSGLHVGIILILLLKIFSPLVHFKHGRILKTLLIILILWMFAFIAGLSASVVRAVTMFTFLAIGQHFGSKRMILFSLFSSLFLLLIFKPLFLFEVGFQLSYLAVLGIITMQQKIYQLIKIKPKFIDFFWQIMSVSLAAQIGVLPLSLYYFHQFPGLFFLSNVVIIPCLGFILMTGIVVIFLSMLEILPQIIADLYGFIISLMNAFISWISNQEAFLFKDLSLSFSLLIASYLIIFLGVRLLHHQSPSKVMLFLGSILVFQSIFLFENYQKNQSKEFIVFHKTKNSVFGFRQSEKIDFLHNVENLESIKSIVTGYKIGENVNVSYHKTESNIYKFENQPILVVDSLGIYELENLKNPMVILQNSPKINLERMISKIHPKIIIADGSNFKTYINRWKTTSNKYKTPFHSTGENGAFRLKN